MVAGQFPSDPSCRKVILVMQQHDVEKCMFEPGAGEALLDEEAYILPFPFRAKGNGPAALKNIIASGVARPGRMLAQSPFDPDIYEDAEFAAQRFAIAKHMYFSLLCRHLGAKEVSAEQIELHTRSGKATLDLKSERNRGGSVQVTAERAELDNFRMQMHLHDEFTGGLADVTSAEDLLRRTGLWADTNMRILLDMRRDGQNKLVTRKLVLGLSNEANNSLNVVGRIKVPAFVKLSAEYDRIVKERHEYTLTVLVRF